MGSSIFGKKSCRIQNAAVLTPPPPMALFSSRRNALRASSAYLAGLETSTIAAFEHLKLSHDRTAFWTVGHCKCQQVVVFLILRIIQHECSGKVCRTRKGGNDHIISCYPERRPAILDSKERLDKLRKRNPRVSRQRFSLRDEGEEPRVSSSRASILLRHSACSVQR